MSGHRLAIGALVAAAFLFGSTFVVVKEAVAGYPPLGFVGWRFLIGAAALLALAVPRSRVVWRDGAAGGVLLFAAYALQTAGLARTAATNSALITGLYVVFTPILASAWRRRMPSPWVLVGVVLAFVGLTLVTVDESLSLGTGDLLTLLCAAGFAGHIVFLGRTAPFHPVIPFTAVQLLTTGVLGLALSLAVERPPLPGGREWPALILTGIGVSALAFLLQIWAQTRVGPGPTAVILTLEPVFGVALAALLLQERLSRSGWVGALLILVAIELVLTRGTREETREAEAISPA